MTTGINIPVNIEGDAPALAALHRIESVLAGTGRSAEAAAPKVQQLGSRFEGLGNAARHVNEISAALTSFGTALVAAADHVAELTSEQQQLVAHSADLGLNFERSAQRAGGFVSSMQTMTLATSLADRGIRATQIELDALARVGMSRASATGKNLSEVFDSLTDIVIQGGEEMTKFGGNLRAVSGSSHSAADRLRAFVEHAKSVAPAMRTATDEMARFRDAVRSAQRTLASAFADEFARLMALPNSLRDAAKNADDFNDKMRAVGMTAAYVVNLVGSGATAVLAYLGSAVQNVIVGVQVLGAGLSSLSRGPSAARAAMDRTAQELLGPESDAVVTGRFASQQWAEFRRLLSAGGSPERTTAAPDTNPTLAGIREANARDRAERNRRQQSGGSGGGSASDVELARIEAGIGIVSRMGSAERASRYGTEYEEVDGIIVRTSDILSRLRRQRIALLTRQTEERRRGEGRAERTRRIAGLRSRIDELTREAEAADSTEATAAVREFVQRQAPARAQGDEVGRSLTGRARESIQKDRETQQEARERDADRSPEAAKAEMDKERGNRREARQLEERRDNYRTFTDELEQLSGRRINAAREEAAFVNHAFQSMGKAFSTHLNAVIEGKEELGVALQGMLADTLSAISQEASIKAGLYLAEGFAALATYRYDAAAASFAAAGIFTAVAVGTGVVGKAIAPSSASKTEGGAGDSKGGDRSAAPMAAGSTTSGGPTVINVAFNGPQFGTGGVVQAARQLAGVINQGALQGGVQINRLAVGVGANG